MINFPLKTYMYLPSINFNFLSNKSQICNFNFYFFHRVVTFSPDNSLGDWNLKSGSRMLNSLHLKPSEDCNLNLINVGKLNTDVDNYVRFCQTTILNEQNVSFPLYLQWKECFTTVTYIHFYNYVYFVLLLMCWKI